MTRLQSLFLPPFRHLRWLIFVVLLVGLAYEPTSLIQTFRLSVPEDYWVAARVVEHVSPSDTPLAQRVFAGQGAIQQRQILDVLPSLFAAPLAKLASGTSAVMLAALVLSLICLTFLFDLLPFLATGFLPYRRRAFAAFFVLFMPALVQGLTAGGLNGTPYALLALACFLICVVRASLRGRRRWVWSAGAVVSLTVYLVFVAPIWTFETPPVWSDALFFKQAFLPLVGLGGACAAILQTKGRRRQRWLILGALLLVSLACALRSSFALAQSQLLALVPLAWFFFYLWDMWAQRDEGPAKYLREAALLLLFGFLPVSLIPAAMLGHPFVPNAVFAGVSRTLPACDLRDVIPVLNPAWTGHQGLAVILAPAADGPEILFRLPTGQPVAMPFDSRGIADSEAFFSAPDEAAARDIVKRRQVDYVLVCKKAPMAKAGTMQAQLGDGKAPEWLKPLWVPIATDMLLFEVKKDKL